MSGKFGLYTFHKLKKADNFWLFWLLVALLVSVSDAHIGSADSPEGSCELLSWCQVS